MKLLDVPVVDIQKRIEQRRQAIRALEDTILKLKETQLTAPTDAFLPGIVTETVDSLGGREIGGVGVPVEALDRPRHLFARGLAGEDFVYPGEDRGNGPLDQRASLGRSNQFAHPANIGRDHRRAAGQRLHPGIGETLVAGRQDHRVAG